MLLLKETARSNSFVHWLQSDPLERQYGQHRQISGGKLLVSLREVESSERILKIKTLPKEDCDWEHCLISNTEAEDCQEMDPNIEEKVMGLELESLTLDKESHEVSVYNFGYIAKKVATRVAD